MHAKLVLVDGHSFSSSVTIRQRYWDDGRHLWLMPLRGPKRILSWRPIHYVSIRVTGKPV